METTATTSKEIGEQKSPDGWVDYARRTLDELFVLTRQYRSSKEYEKLLKFIVQFREYSPFNAMLVHLQMSGATFVAPPSRWTKKYWRMVKTAARPLAILRPMGPVMFVFDLSDTEPIPAEQRTEIEKLIKMNSSRTIRHRKTVCGPQMQRQTFL